MAIKKLLKLLALKESYKEKSDVEKLKIRAVHLGLLDYLKSDNSQYGTLYEHLKERKNWWLLKKTKNEIGFYRIPNNLTQEDCKELVWTSSLPYRMAAIKILKGIIPQLQ